MCLLQAMMALSSLGLLCSVLLVTGATGQEPFSLRLVGGSSRCRGDLQLQKSGQDWIGVSPFHFPVWFGERVCAELGCGSVLSVDWTKVSERDVVDLAPHDCINKEDSSLIHCFRPHVRRSQDSLMLSCSDSVRLVSGRSLCSGSVQIRASDRSWTWVCEGALDRRGAEVLCRELGCGPPLLQGELSPLGQTFHCEGHESALMDCPQTDPRTCSGPAQHLTCSDVRLVGGPSRCEGTLEVLYSGTWRRVCVPWDSWDLEAAGAVCRDLSCGSAVSTEVKQDFITTAAWGIRAACARREESVRGCVVANYARRDDGLDVVCSGARAANRSSEEPYRLRLVDGGGQCQGQLQVWRSGRGWSGVYPSFVPLWFGHRVCAELGCGSALAVKQKTVSGGEAVHVSPRACENTSLINCFSADAHSSPYSLELLCSDSVRLVSGRSLCSGSVQIRDQSQSWTSVCEGALDRRGAEVLCRELGCGPPLLQGALSPLGQTFHCEGHESALMDCPQTKPGTCSGAALHLTCSDPVRLVGGASRCKGTVELSVRGEWRRMWTSWEPWDLEAGAAVCGALGCGSAVFTDKRRELNASDVWVVSSDCMKTASAVRGCHWAGLSGSEGGLDLVCSGGAPSALSLVLVPVLLIITNI